MDANEIAAALNEIAILLELRGENVFKINAYRKAARALETLTQPLDNLIAEGNLAKVDGIGKALLIKIETLHKTNRLEELEHLRGWCLPDSWKCCGCRVSGPKGQGAIRGAWDRLVGRTQRSLRVGPDSQGQGIWSKDSGKYPRGDCLSEGGRRTGSPPHCS